MDRETNEERQENELQFLQEVYGAVDLRVDDPRKVSKNQQTRSEAQLGIYICFLAINTFILI